MTTKQKVAAGAFSVIAATATLAGVASPAQAAYPTTTFTLKYGNSYASGNIAWQNRSVRLTGNIAVTAGNCRWIEAGTYYLDSKGEHYIDGDARGPYCNSGSSTMIDQFDFTVPADISGGAEMVKVEFGEDLVNPFVSKKCFKATPC
ncbi:hypothetical protein GCM10010112_44090 [Actinoplanes lobatus]|uniref:Secreted protein n=1 Tax=Actinoplanes lobatus TaxID=113568 RepID=A0A7W7HBL6_9ACTN|nr:hypothetical protein [Actinoplanes lobatus]MBB4747553.1 hypothetical protein [Actinoplanes lobatus]GGN74200.1 hypothetical protein GCM10010112_44090 [Actinoplanes lobatus]GIE39886.1 hypothetical protein Alo02nite_27840 [Actinoplanes lobatus]